MQFSLISLDLICAYTGVVYVFRICLRQGEVKEHLQFGAASCCSELLHNTDHILIVSWNSFHTPPALQPGPQSLSVCIPVDATAVAYMEK